MNSTWSSDSSACCPGSPSTVVASCGRLRGPALATGIAAGRLTARVGRMIGWATVGVGLAIALADQVTGGIVVLALGWLVAMGGRTLSTGGWAWRSCCAGRP